MTKMKKTKEKTMVYTGVFFTTLLLLCLIGISLAFLDRNSYFNDDVKTERCREAMINIGKGKDAMIKAYEIADGAEVKMSAVIDYVESGSARSACPAGGTYSANPAGTPPSCSIVEHNPQGME